MATRVNTKVVIGIVAGILVLAVGVIGLVAWSQQQSGERNIARGNAAMEAGDFERAQDQYSRAVNKEPTNTEAVQKWGEALVKCVPDTDVSYRERYAAYFSGVLARLAQQRPQEGDLQLRFINELVRQTRLGGAMGIGSADNIITTVTDRAAGMREDDENRVRVLRWRGFALAGKAPLVSLTDEEYMTGVADLEAAYELERDPKVLLDLYRLHTAVAVRAEMDRNEGVASEARAKAEEAMARVSANHPDHPNVLALNLELARREAVAAEGTFEQRTEMLQDDIRRAVDGLTSLDVTKFPADDLVSVVAQVARFVGNQDKVLLSDLLQRKHESDPSNTSLLMLRGSILGDANEYEAAHDVYQSVVDMPNLAVSLDGLLLLDHRTTAIYEQARLKLEQARLSDDPDERDAFIADARALRETLKDRVSTRRERLVTVLDMQTALVAGEPREALEHLAKLDGAGMQDSPDVLLGYVQALVALNQPGDARQKLIRLNQVTGGRNTTQVTLYWGEVERMMGNYENALAFYERLAQAMPQNQMVATRVAQMRALTGAAVDEGADPVIVAIDRARELRTRGDYEGAVALLEQGVAENPDNQRLLPYLVSLDVAMDNRAKAAQRLREALERDPGNARLNAMLTQVEIDDPVEAQLAIIEASDEAPVNKALGRESVYRRAGFADKADEALAEARRLDETNPAVVASSFTNAARKGKAGLDEAARVVEIAQRTDADGNGGEIYRGRLEILRGNLNEAIAILTALTNANEYNADAWRWLGAAQRSAGRIDDAVKSYARAFNARPSDFSFAADYANALVAAGRGREAAAILSPDTGVLKRASANDQISEMWMRLEGEYGDRQRVLAMRERTFSRSPVDVTNTLALVDLLVRDRDLERANEVVEIFASQQGVNPLRVAQARSAVLDAEGKNEQATQTLEDYVASVPENERGIEPYLILSRAYELHGDAQRAADALRRGQQYQGPTRILNRSLADLQFRSASRARAAANQDGGEVSPEQKQVYTEAYREAKVLYEGILGNGFDELVAKRVAECQLRTEEYGALEQTLDELAQEIGNPNDLQILLLRAVSYQAQGDTDNARRMLDLAVQHNPTNPDAFYRRALFNAGTQALLPDVIADLEQATKLRPGFVDAWTLLAQTHAMMGESEQAFQKLRGAIESNPNDEQLPRVLVDLLVALGQRDAAYAEASEWLAKDEENEYWLTKVALLAQANRDYDTAYRWYTKLDESSELENGALAVARLDALLRRNAGVEIPEVNRLMRRVDALEVDEANTLSWIILRARAEAARGNVRKSDELFIEAHALARPQGPTGLVRFVEGLMLRFKADQNKAFAFIRDTEALRPLHPYLMLEMIQPNVYAAQTAEQRQRVNSDLEQVGSMIDANDRITQHRFYRLASDLRYALGDYEGCVQASAAALQLSSTDGNPLSSTDANMANNLAYTLSTHMGKHEEALPYAERAAELQPNSAIVLDTLGVIQLRLGRIEEALRTLERAVANAVSENDKAAALIHKTEALIESGEMVEAMRTSQTARRALDNASPQTRELYQKELDKLAERLR